MTLKNPLTPTTDKESPVTKDVQFLIAYEARMTRDLSEILDFINSQHSTCYTVQDVETVSFKYTTPIITFKDGTELEGLDRQDWELDTKWPSHVEAWTVTDKSLTDLMHEGSSEVIRLAPQPLTPRDIVDEHIIACVTSSMDKLARKRWTDEFPHDLEELVDSVFYHHEKFYTHCGDCEACEEESACGKIDLDGEYEDPSHLNCDDPVENEYEDPLEIPTCYIVSSALGQFLKDHDHPVGIYRPTGLFDNELQGKMVNPHQSHFVWGRVTFGQLIESDYIIQKFCDFLNNKED